MSKKDHIGKSIRKVIQIGASSGVTLPIEFLEISGIKRGEKVEMLYSEKSAEIKPISLDPART